MPAKAKARDGGGSLKISRLKKRWRKPERIIDGCPSCVWCVDGDHVTCERWGLIFCNCWISKHTLPKEDVHRWDLRQNVDGRRVGRKPTTAKKG